MFDLFLCKMLLHEEYAESIFPVRRGYKVRCTGGNEIIAEKTLCGELKIKGMKYRKILTVCFVLWFCYTSCNLVDETPVGYRIELMKDTPVWELAKAVKEEDTDRIRELIQEKHLDVNYQERKSPVATTLLHLAVGNDKLLSVEALLNNGARQNIRDSGGNYPINDIVQMIVPHKHRLEILKLLLDHGADPNAVAAAYRHGNTIPYQISMPLFEAVKDLECTKLLLKYGADMNYHTLGDSLIDYPVWTHLFFQWDDLEWDNNVLVAKYLIVDKQMPFPDTLFIDRDPSGKLFSVTSMQLINKSNFAKPDRQKAKEEILAYLKAEGYPAKGALSDRSK